MKLITHCYTSCYSKMLKRHKIENRDFWKIAVCLDYYLLCFEDLDTKYTVKDEQKYPDCKAGTYKKCHRTVLAKVLNKKYGLNIKEWKK